MSSTFKKSKTKILSSFTKEEPKNLAFNMYYQFDINIKADLFEVIIKFPKVK